MTEYEKITQAVEASLERLRVDTEEGRRLAGRLFTEIAKELHAPEGLLKPSPAPEALVLADDGSFKMNVSLTAGPGVLAFAVELTKRDNGRWFVRVGGATDLYADPRMDVFRELIAEFAQKATLAIRDGGPSFLGGDERDHAEEQPILPTPIGLNQSESFVLMHASLGYAGS